MLFYITRLLQTLPQCLHICSTATQTDHNTTDNIITPDNPFKPNDVAQIFVNFRVHTGNYRHSYPSPLKQGEKQTCQQRSIGLPNQMEKLILRYLTETEIYTCCIQACRFYRLLCLARHQRRLPQ